MAEGEECMYAVRLIEVSDIDSCHSNVSDDLDLDKAEARELCHSLLDQLEDNLNQQLMGKDKAHSIFGDSQENMVEDTRGFVEEYMEAHQKYVQKMGSTLHDLQEKLRNVSTEKDRLSMEKDSLATERDSLARENKRLAIEIASLTTENNRLATEKHRLASKNDRLATKNDRLTTKKDRLAKEKVQLTTEKDQLTREKNRLTRENDCLTTRNNDLTIENGHLIAEKGRATVENERLKEVIFSNKIVYPMRNSPKGVCLIINNINFKGMDRRVAAEADTDRLTSVFGSFDFEVMTFQDLDHSKMVDVMMKQGEDDHSNHDCFVCCIMSHGTTGKVFSSNDVGLDILELIKPLTATRCPSLSGKPKLFFIQACQGEKHQCPQRMDSQIDVSATSTFVAKEADIFYGLATVPGYTAIRHDYGAPYVHHLACTFTKYGKTHDLLTMMTMVNENMNTSEQGRLVSSIHSTLRKKVYLCKTE